MSRHSSSLIAIAASLLLPGASPAFADGPQPTTSTSPSADPVALRATRPELPGALVRYVANYAQPRQLDRSAYPEAHEASAGSIIRVLCGKAQPGYAELFRERNRLGPDFNMTAPLGERVYGLQWPACFYVSEHANEVVVDPYDTLSHSFVELTGRAGSRSEMQNYYGRKNIDQVMPGLRLPTPYATQPVNFVPLIDNSVFLENVDALAYQPDGHSKAAVQSATQTSPEADEIVTAADGRSQAGNYQPPLDCLDPAEAPAWPARLRKVVAMLEDVDKQSQVNVIVLDNGFSGARSENGRLRFASKFPRKMFEIASRPGQEEFLEEPILLHGSTYLGPLVRLPENGEAQHVAGHGTHIAGAILGGQWLDPAGSLYALNENESWLRLRIIPLSAGEKAVSRAALNEAAQRVGLARPDIVNMSVRYGVTRDQRLTNVISDRTDVLFIVAAGNDGRDVQRKEFSQRTLTPANLGGSANPNVITVAAEDGQGYLTHFSNYGTENVDIAAPGCNIPSWLDGEHVTALSGTSQATAVVSFTAALLARYRLDAHEIKRRIVTSGDILDGKRVLKGDHSQREPVADNGTINIRSRSRLNIEKALLFEHDYLRVSEGTKEIELIGSLAIQGRINCGDPIDARLVLAIKRSRSGGLWCFTSDRTPPSPASSGEDFQVIFQVKDVLTDTTGAPTSFSKGSTRQIAIADIREFIRSDAQMTRIQEEH